MTDKQYKELEEAGWMGLTDLFNEFESVMEPLKTGNSLTYIAESQSQINLDTINKILMEAKEYFNVNNIKFTFRTGTRCLVINIENKI